MRHIYLNSCLNSETFASNGMFLMRIFVEFFCNFFFAARLPCNDSDWLQNMSNTRKLASVYSYDSNNARTKTKDTTGTQLFLIFNSKPLRSTERCVLKNY